MKRIYLDYAATTPLSSEVIKVIERSLSNNFGNPSSIHYFGQTAREKVEHARRTVASFLGAAPEEIIFTSGGSESNNLAIKGIVRAFYSNNQETRNPTPLKLRGAGNNQTNFNIQNSNVQNLTPRTYNLKPLHVITSAFEHHAVLETIKELESEGVIEATYIKPGADGIISVKEVEKAIKENTILVSIMYVNNEIGTVQPIREIGKLIEKINQKSKIKNQNYCRIYFHTDAVQAVEYFNVNVDYLHIDALTFTAHKIYGPKGTGVLYLRKGVPLKKMISGGGQENKRRAGTENVAGIIGLEKAVELIAREQQDLKASINDELPELISTKEAARQQNLRDYLIKNLTKIHGVRLNGDKKRRSPNNINIIINNAEGEALLLSLDLEGVAVSSGSACTSGSLEPSHVLLSLGIPAEKAHGSLRITLGRETTKDEIDYFITILPPIIERVRKMSPFPLTKVQI